MNPSKLEDWKEAVTQLNEDANNLIHNREKLYEVMADDIKRIFAKMDLFPENVSLESSAHTIKVKFKAGDRIIIDPVIMTQLNMKFRITGGYNDNGVWRIIIVFNPFEDD